MVQFRKILFYADESPWVAAALRRALFVAQHMQAQLTLCGVVERVTQEVRFPDRIITPSEIQRATRMDRLDELAELLKKVGGASRDVREQVLVGSPSHEVVRAVLEDGHDLLVTGAQGESDPTPLLFGTVDMQLLRRCPCPVWLVKPNRQGRCRRILAALDPEPPADQGEDLNTTILDIGASLAALEDAELHVLHAWKPRGETVLMGGRFGLSSRDAESWLEEGRQAHHEWLAELVTANSFGKRPETHLVRGDPSRVIPELAEELSMDLIVMATVRHKGIRGLFIDSTAEQVLGQVQCSVLAVKPKGLAKVVQESLLGQPVDRVK